MTLAIAYHHRDARQTLKLLSWIVYLSARAEAWTKKERLLLTVSRGASQGSVHKQIVSIAKTHFQSVYVNVPADEHETGWPGAANFMFAETLKFHNGFDELFWLEPDAIPLKPEWWKRVGREWDVAKKNGKHFMGARVLTKEEHMTGVGVYSADWKKFAPLISEVVENQGWDLHAAKQIVPNAHFTNLIQHVFRGPPIMDLSILHPDAVIFHQDKEGRLINMLAALERRSDLVKLFAELDDHEETTMSQKFYLSDNISRPVKSQGLEFTFEQVDQIGGVGRGVFATDVEREQIALDALAENPQSGVTALDTGDYERLIQKKTRQRPSSRVFPLGLKSSASMKENPAARVADPPAVKKPEPEEMPKPLNFVDDLESVLQIGVVKRAQELPNMKPKRGENKRRT